MVAWLAAAAAFAEELLSEQQVAMAAAGGPRRALRADALLALAAVGVLLAFLDVAFPALFGLFDRTPAVADLAAAALAHLGMRRRSGSAWACWWSRPRRGVRTRPSWSSPSTRCSPCPLYDLAPVLSPVAWLAVTLNDAAPRTLGVGRRARRPRRGRAGARWRWPPGMRCVARAR